jgi:hypothetical protein
MTRFRPRPVRLAGASAGLYFASAIVLLLFVGGGIVRADDNELAAFRLRVLSLLESFPTSSETESVTKALASAETFREFDAAAAPLTLATVGINPEARVKIGSAPDRIELVAGQPRRFLVRVENLAGVTAPLRIRGLDLASPDAGEATWFRLRFVDAESDNASLPSAMLTGATDEYVAVEVLIADPGIREIRLAADAGQGTQDLGFRATADVQVRTRSAGPTP